MLDGTEPILDEEELYRRIPVSTSWYDATKDQHPSPKAFRPRASDVSGLSVFRAKYTSGRDVAQNNRGARYYVAVLRAGDLRMHGIDVIPKPIPPTELGHAELPGLRYDNRGDNEAEGWQVLLAERLCLRIEGPYPEA